MKTIFYSLATLVFISVMGACDSDSKEMKSEEFSYRINVRINNLRGPVILMDRSTYEPVKTIYSKSPAFTMEGTLPMDKLHANFLIHCPSKYSNPFFYPVKEACAVEFKIDTLTDIKAHYDSLLFASVENSYMSSLEDFKKKYFPEIVEFDVFNMASFKESKGERRSEKDQIAYANKGNALLAKVSKAILDRTDKYSENVFMAEILANWAGQISLEELNKRYNNLTEEVKVSAAGAKVRAMAEYMEKQSKPESLKAGDMAPNFNLPDESGKKHKLSDFKGKYVILDFWASWCGPCKREMPFMKKLYEEFQSKGLEMINISTDEDRDKWLKAKNKLDMPNLQLHDEKGEASARYFVRGIPYVLLINPDGIIQAIERGEALKKRLEKIYAK